MRRCAHSFGLVGNANSYFTSALTESGFGYTSVRHEAAAITAADAFYRAGGGMAIATTTCGAGFTNTLTSLAEAKKARIPLVYVAGTHPATPRPFDIDQAALLDALEITYITATEYSARQDATIAADLAEALREPVVVQIPTDIQKAPLIDDGERAQNQYDGGVGKRASSANAQRPMFQHHEGEIDRANVDIADIASGLSAAQRPLIVVGRGVTLSGTEELVRTIGDRVGAVFMHSAMARHAISGTWDAGLIGGFASADAVELARTADTVLILGASFNAFQSRGGSMFSPDATVMQIIDQPHPSSLAVDMRYYEPLEDVLPVLLHLTDPREGSASWREELREQYLAAESAKSAAESDDHSPTTLADAIATQVPATLGEDGRLDPRACLSLLDEIAPPQRTICTDGGHFLGWVPSFMDVPGPEHQVIVGSAIQSIGMGFGSLIGIAAARPTDFSILVSGDGGGLMSSADLSSAIATMHRGAIVFINDAAYGAELHQYNGTGLDTVSMVIDDIDFAGLGEVAGARGFTVATPEDFQQLCDYFADMDADTNPANRYVAVIDFKVSRAVVADFISSVLKKQH